MRCLTDIYTQKLHLKNALISTTIASGNFNFKIRGRNPLDPDCKAYIDSKFLPFDMWFGYAIAKHESKDYGGEPYYNQFLANGGKYSPETGKEGIPLHSKAQFEEGPGGFGMFQVTGTPADKDKIISRGQIWNWKDNVDAALDIIIPKRNQALAWMVSQKQQANVPLPSHTVAGVLFQNGSGKIMEDAVTMKAYNGASRAPTGFIDNENIPGFYLNPTKAGHYCYWDNVNPNPQNTWALSRYNKSSPPFNYVFRVCQEVE